MDIYLIILTTESEDVENSIFSYIKGAFTSWARLNKSVFIVKSDILRETTVRDMLKPLIPQDSKLFVVEITDSSWASYKVKKEVIDWLKR